MPTLSVSFPIPAREVREVREACCQNQSQAHLKVLEQDTKSFTFHVYRRTFHGPETQLYREQICKLERSSVTSGIVVAILSALDRGLKIEADEEDH